MRTRLAALDGLRAVGIALVFVYHAGIPGTYAGRLGVDVFFSLSGFLITSLLLREYDDSGRIALWSFYTRRAARLYPALLAAVALVFVWGSPLGFGNIVDWWHSAGPALSYVTNIAISWHGHPSANTLSPTWSLALEEQFYVLWPVALWLLLRSGLPRRGVAAVTAGLALLSWYVLSTAPTGPGYFRPDARAGGLMIGCAMAVLLSRASLDERVGRLALRLAAALALPAVVIATSGQHEAIGNALGIPLVSLATALLIPALIARPASGVARAMAWPLCVWIGQRSYGIYLVHLGVIRVLQGNGASRLVVASAGAALSIAIAAVVYRFVEQPVLAWSKCSVDDRRVHQRLQLPAEVEACLTA